MFEDKKGKIAQLIIARLDGKDIKRRFKYYESLVKKGIGGFVIFGGRLDDVITGIKRLQDIAKNPLFICSDLEQGLGQQIKGGTLFPPAMAIAQAINPHSRRDVKLLRDSINIIANEAKATGINVIFSPVLDVNTNPKNPIICTRAFSDNPETVAWFGKEFIRGFQSGGLIACAKHFPGHGDTVKDSHKELPVARADMRRLQRIELYPFYSAIKSGVKMIMAGHLKVPAIDSRMPASLSQKTIQGLLRAKMGFKGLVITDAMNMHAVSGRDSESEGRACLQALNAGADIILHPSNPEKVIDYLFSGYDEIEVRVEESYLKVLKAKEKIKRMQARYKMQDIGKRLHWETAKELTEKSINIKLEKCRSLTDLCHSRADRNDIRGRSSGQIVIFIIDDDDNKSGDAFVKCIKQRYAKVKTIYIDNNYQGSVIEIINSLSDKILVAAIFSKISAWKGRAVISRKLKTVLKKAVEASGYSILTGFCYPHAISDLKADTIINAYSGSELVQEAVAEILCAS